MASQAKLTVDFRPTKRIKKRRELDALVSTKQRSLGRSGTGSATGRNELLRDESETSEMEEFDAPAKLLLPKRSRSCTCSACVGLGGGVLLAACLVSICGLVAMYVQLRKDVTELQSRLAKVDDLSSSFSSQLHDLSSVQRDFSLRLQRFNNGLNDIRTNISTIFSQVNALDGSLKSLGSDMSQWQSANSLAPNNPNDIAAKTKHLPRDQLSEEEEADDEALLEQLSPKFSWMEKKLNLLNVTCHRRLEEMKAHSALVDVSMSALSNYTLLLNKRIRFLEVLPGGARKPSSDELFHLVDDMLQSQIGMLNVTIDAMSDKLDAVLSSIETLRNSTNSNIRTLNLTTLELSARLKLIEVTVHMMLSDSIASEATPEGKVDPGGPPQSASVMKPRPGSGSSTTDSNIKNQMKIGRSTAVLGSLPRS